MRQVVFRRQARLEFDEAGDWYEKERPGLGLEFLAEIHRLIQRIAGNPEQFPMLYRDVRKAVAKLADEYPEFVARHPEVQWKSMRGMRNRMAHGYFDINLDIVWDTIQQSIPVLGQQIRQIQQNS